MQSAIQHDDTLLHVCHCRSGSPDQGQQQVSEDCCAWELLHLCYLLAPRSEGIITQACPTLPVGVPTPAAGSDHTFCSFHTLFSKLHAPLALPPLPLPNPSLVSPWPTVPAHPPFPLHSRVCCMPTATYVVCTCICSCIMCKLVHWHCSTQLVAQSCGATGHGDVGAQAQSAAGRAQRQPPGCLHQPGSPSPRGPSGS